MKESGIELRKMTVAALLIALGIVIPTFMPLKFVLEPASFTLASHVPVFLSMFVSPWVALVVAAGTALGFVLGGFPPIIILRAASHVVFALLGALYLRKKPEILKSAVATQLFSFVVGVIHAICEFGVASVFYFGGGMSDLNYNKGFFVSIVLLVGVGALVHSMLDFAIALAVRKILRSQQYIRKLLM